MARIKYSQIQKLDYIAISYQLYWLQIRYYWNYYRNIFNNRMLIPFRKRVKVQKLFR